MPAIYEKTLSDHAIATQSKRLRDVSVPVSYGVTWIICESSGGEASLFTELFGSVVQFRNKLSNFKTWAIVQPDSSHKKAKNYYPPSSYQDVNAAWAEDYDLTVLTELDRFEYSLPKYTLEILNDAVAYPIDSNSTLFSCEVGKKEIAPKTESAYQNIIGSMVGLLVQTVNYESQADIIAALRAQHRNKHGLSKRHLEATFAKAKRSLHRA